MIFFLRKVSALLSPAERRRAGWLLLTVLLAAMVDVLGVASIMPFIAVVARPELIESNQILSFTYDLAKQFGVATVESFIFALGVVVFILLLSSLALKAGATYAQLRFAMMREYSLGRRLVEGYLAQPYSWFLTKHSSDLGKTVLSEVAAVINGVLVPLMNLIAQGSVAVALLCLLVAVDPELAIIVGISLTTAYAIVFGVSRAFIGRIGRERFAANQERYKLLSEALNAVKEIKVSRLEKLYVERFSHPALLFARHNASAQAISQLPRFALEAVAFGGMLIVILYLMTKSPDLESALPTIALYAFAGYRLMPALQQVYGAVTALKYSGPILDAIHRDLVDLERVPNDAEVKPITFDHSIKFENVKYGYPKSDRLAVNNLNFLIPAHSVVGLVGSTGSGKTTTVDLLLGLLEPTAGSISVNGRTIDRKNVKEWQKLVAYVPQQIFLSDDTIAANIAFGIEKDKVDLTAVVAAAKCACLHDFVIDNLKDGYNTTVGERGVRLSGGQRQRIGIARAIYRNPEVLILDEATSALDNVTEHVVMEGIRNLRSKMTIIIIAHRLSTIQDCDDILLFEKGEILDSGNYDRLFHSSGAFRKLTGVSR